MLLCSLEVSNMPIVLLKMGEIPSTKCSGYDSKLPLIKIGECGAQLLCHNKQIYSDPY